jgi:hypothetical protein
MQKTTTCFDLLYYYLSNMKGHYFFTLFFILFFTLGPALPKPLYGHSMLEIQGDVFLFGGGNSGYDSAIYQLTCSSVICGWATLNQALTVGREDTVAIPVPDYFCT